MRFFIGDTHLMDESMIRLERQPFGNASEKKLTMIGTKLLEKMMRFIILVMLHYVMNFYYLRKAAYLL